MTVLRREDVQSKVASWDECPYRTVSSPILTIVPLIVRRLRGPVAGSASTRVISSRPAIVSKPTPVRVVTPPTGSPPVLGQLPRRSSAQAYGPPRVCEIVG